MGKKMSLLIILLQIYSKSFCKAKYFKFLFLQKFRIESGIQTKESGSEISQNRSDFLFLHKINQLKQMI